jgi:hypothetical protein
MLTWLEDSRVSCRKIQSAQATLDTGRFAVNIKRLLLTKLKLPTWPPHTNDPEAHAFLNLRALSS